MYETSKAVQRRLHDPNFISRYFKGGGIDIGSGNDPLAQYIELFPLMDTCISWDKQHGDAQEMSGVPDETYAFVHASHCLEDMTRPDEALKNWFRILKPGGHLIVTVPDEDMYEQGVFPSTFNTDHKWTFTIFKQRSWTKFSQSLTGMIAQLGHAADIIKIERLTGTYRFGLPRQDQTRTPIGEAAIEFIVRKRRQTEIDAGMSSPIVDFKPQPATKPKIALHRPGAYGDIIMTLALVPLLKQKYPDHEIHYICNRTIGTQLAGLMQAAGVNKLLDSVSASNTYDKLFNLVGYPLAEGYPEKPMTRHLIDYFGDEMGIDVGSQVDMPYLTLSRPPRPEGLPARYATIHPQAGWSVYKNWPRDRWESVIAERPDIPFYMIGGETDAPLVGANHTFMGKPFYDSISLLANAELHLGVDTWTNHLTNIEWEDSDDKRSFVPAIILWGSTQWQAAGYSRNRNISLGLSCQPCFREDPKISRMPRGPCINPPRASYGGDSHACMTGIAVDRVLAEIEKLWPQ
jgi:ADP-heptose:LPS heptosyltransferase/SAM-dependent methyltransferase